MLADKQESFLGKSAIPVVDSIWQSLASVLRIRQNKNRAGISSGAISFKNC